MINILGDKSNRTVFSNFIVARTKKKWLNGQKEMETADSMEHHAVPWSFQRHSSFWEITIQMEWFQE